MENKRILIFSLEYYPIIGGAEIAVKEITDRITDIEFDMVTMQSRRDLARHEKVGNVNVYRIPTSKVLFPIEAALFARKLHSGKPYDAIWSIMAARAGGAALFFKYSFPEVKFFLTLQEGDPVWYMKLRSFYYVNPFFRKIFSNADKVHAISNYLADYAKTMGHEGKVEVIPNGVDTKEFEDDAMSISDEEKVKLGIKTTDRLLITTSRLVRKNGIKYAIEAMPGLPQHVKFLIIGTGPLEKSLKAKVKSLNLGERVIFLGQVPNADIILYLKIADIFIRPSLSEGFGISFIEAFAAELPVIATPVGGIVDFLFDPEASPGKKPTGLFVEPADSQSIVKQVTRLFKDDKLRSELTSNAKDLVKEKYDWNLIAREMRSRVFNI
ncbi:MAG: glycosyltransferase family 4 protein [bacterium]|nr:glycosyltransferase family 4 protein [bacterium]